MAPPQPPSAPPSPWVRRFAPMVPAGGAVLDLACGGGRHARLFIERGHPVTALDRDVTLLTDLPEAEILRADLEDGSLWPLPGRRFAGIVVANYLHRPLFPVLLESLDQGGVLIYETFALGHEAWSRPRNPDHLLRPHELLEAAAQGGLQVVAFEQGLLPAPAVVQRICAVRGGGPLPLVQVSSV